jgi:hypothetical protein
MNTYNGKTVKEIHVKAGVRYWEDAIINDIADETGQLTPCRDGDNWCPIIDVETGTIKNWATGTYADMHFKVCDECGVKLIGENDEVLYECEDGYVPKVLCPNENGYGDYIIMTIDGDGVISNWNPTFEDIGNEDDN